jgi:hypothetical protein
MLVTDFCAKTSFLFHKRRSLSIVMSGVIDRQKWKSLVKPKAVELSFDSFSQMILGR